MSTVETTHRRTHWYQRRWLKITSGILIAIILIPIIAINVSAWPGSMFIRYVFERNAAEVLTAMEAHAPDSVTLIANEAYRPDDDDARLDVYFPSSLTEGQQLPTVIWTHGGAWISGDKTNAGPYFQLLADAGFTVVALNYSYGPEETYPTAVHQLNDAHAYVLANAERLHVDPDQIFLAGDSAGAQLSSQLAAIITNPDFAADMGITPSLSPDQLSGLVLNCGIYDMAAFTDTTGATETLLTRLLVWGTTTSLWAYTGSRDLDSDDLSQMSSINYVTADYPPSWISGGNGDPLTDQQSRPLAAKLESLGVDVTTVFYPEDHEPSLGHEYQFNLDNEDGQNALASTIDFLRAHSTSPVEAP
jgi:acetyl esterase/lipase